MTSTSDETPGNSKQYELTLFGDNYWHLLEWISCPDSVFQTVKRFSFNILLFSPSNVQPCARLVLLVAHFYHVRQCTWLLILISFQEGTIVFLL